MLGSIPRVVSSDSVDNDNAYSRRTTKIGRQVYLRPQKGYAEPDGSSGHGVR